MVDKNLKYSNDGFWVRKEENTYRVGLSLSGIEEVGDITFVDLPRKGEIKSEDPFLNVEASKVVSEFSTPLSGNVLEVNDALLDNPENLKVNDIEKNWIAVINNVSERDLAKLIDEKPEMILSHIEMS